MCIFDLVTSKGGGSNATKLDNNIRQSNGRPYYYCIGKIILFFSSICFLKLKYLSHFCMDFVQIFRAFVTFLNSIQSNKKK